MAAVIFQTKDRHYFFPKMASCLKGEPGSRFMRRPDTAEERTIYSTRTTSPLGVSSTITSFLLLLRVLLGKSPVEQFSNLSPKKF